MEHLNQLKQQVNKLNKKTVELQSKLSDICYYLSTQNSQTESFRQSLEKNFYRMYLDQTQNPQYQENEQNEEHTDHIKQSDEHEPDDPENDQPNHSNDPHDQTPD